MNKYEKWYNNLIERAIERNWNKTNIDIYLEKHHIIPKSIGGNNKNSNLVFLTAREHFIAHMFLARFGDENQKKKMTYALTRFLFSMKEKSFINSYAYEYLKNNKKNILSERMLGNNYRKNILHTDETKRKMSEKRKGVSKSEETKKKMKISSKRRWETAPIITCPYCGLSSVNKSNMTRFHFNNCKDKKCQQ